MDTALSEIRVVELTQFSAGACCAQFLAWLGADVVKVEPPGGGADRFAASEAQRVDSYDFILQNTNKRSVVLDLETEQGRSNLTKLIASADVVVEHLAPGAAESRGFGWDAVRRINPRIVYAQIRGCASGTARSNHLCDDLVAQAIGGSMATTGYYDGPPLATGAAFADTSAALHAVMGIIAALHQREHNGRGQRVEVALQDAVINLQRIHYPTAMQKRKPHHRVGNNSGVPAVPSDVYPCKPGGPNDYVLIHISKSANQHWFSLLKAMGRDDLLNNPDWATTPGRVADQDKVDALVANWTKNLTKLEAMDAVQKAGAPAAAVMDVRDLIEDAELRRSGMMVTVTHPERGAVTMPGWPVRLSNSIVPVTCSPALGAHTAEVLQEWLAPRKSASAAPAATVSPDAQALTGIKVLDFTQFEAGPACTEVLAWLGADVVKIEEPKKGDRGRLNTEIPGIDSCYFILLNANKRSVTCDLKSQAGKDLVAKLIAVADVVIENMAPGAIERLGLGYDEVRRINPNVVYAQIKGFAPDGHRAEYLCFDSIGVAAGGATSVTGTNGDKPLRPGAHLGDTGTGLHCATGILAALYQRRKTGRGQRVQAAMSEAVINFNRPIFASYLATGKVPGRDGTVGLYRCKGDGYDDYCYVAITNLNDTQWKSLLEAIGRLDRLDDPRFKSAAKRIENKAEIDAMLTPWCLARAKIDVMETLQRAGVPAGAVLGTHELYDDPHLRESGMFVAIDHPKRGPLVIPGWAVRMSHSPTVVRSAPLHGQHTQEVAADWLEVSAGETQSVRLS